MKLKKLLFIAVAAIDLTTFTKAQPQPFNWAYGYGGTNPSNRDFAHGVSTDSSGNTYICGQFQGSMIVQSFAANSSLYREPFVTKLTPVVLAYGSFKDTVKEVQLCPTSPLP